MPHVIVKLWPGKTEAQKSKLARQITESVTSVLDYGEESVSVAIQEIDSSEWKDKVYDCDIKQRKGELYKEPGYRM